MGVQIKHEINFLKINNFDQGIWASYLCATYDQ